MEICTVSTDFWP